MRRLVHTTEVARRSALAGSVTVHGAIALVAVIAAHERTVTRSAPQPPPVEIELVGPSPPPPSPEPPAAAGASPAAKAPVPRVASRVRAIAAKAQRRSSADDEVTMRIEPPGSATDAAGEASGGREGGLGDGQGRGIGFGAGRGDADAAVASLAVPTPDLVPRPSQARPPTLIYPRRNRDIDDERLFVARLTIDGDGFVVGARLLEGRSSPGAERAASAVWRFRYRPALDAAGRPITVTIDQRFLVDH
jgi:periplasmic protein TonB